MGTVYSQLSITERRRTPLIDCHAINCRAVERWRQAKVPVDEMARVLKRCREHQPEGQTVVATQA